MPDTSRTRRRQTGSLTTAQLLLIIALVGVIAVGALFLTGVLPQGEHDPCAPRPAPSCRNLSQSWLIL